MGKFMDFMDDFVFGPINFINRAEGIIKQKAYRDTAVKFSILRIDKGGTHTRGEVRAIIKKYEVPAFGTTHDSKCLHFLVKNRQAAWAEYVLLHAGIELQNPPVNPKNYEYVRQHESGWMPTAWEDQKGNVDSANVSKQRPAGVKTQSSGLNSQLDRIIDWIDQGTLKVGK